MRAMQWSLYTFLPAMPPVHIPDSSGPLVLPETPLAASRRSVRSQQRRHLLVAAGQSTGQRIVPVMVWFILVCSVLKQEDHHG